MALTIFAIIRRLGVGRFGFAIALVAALMLLFGLTDVAGAAARSGTEALAGYLQGVAPDTLVPGANRFGPSDGTPPVAPAFAGDTVVGYVYLTSDFVSTIGYSGKPIDVLVGLDTEGTITGTKLVRHQEPIVLIGIPERRIVEFMAGYVGFNPQKMAAESKTTPDVDIVSGATVTVLVIGDSLTRSAARVAQTKGLGGASPAASAGPRRELDPNAGTIADWETLVGEGAVRRLHLTVGEVNEAFRRTGDERAMRRPEPGGDDETFIDLYVALIDQPAIGRSLLGAAEYENVRRTLGPDRHLILVAAEGRYSFKGSGFVRGGIFDRVELVQGSETIRFRDRQHRRTPAVEAAGAPRLREIDVFAVPDDAAFDPAAPWRLSLLVQRSVGALERAFVSFEVGYRLPERYLKPLPAAAEAPAATGPDAADEGFVFDALFDTGDAPLWLRVWRSKIASIAALVAMLLALTALFFFQDVLVRRERLLDGARLAYLAVTLLWLGWVAQAQLSVVNVVTFAHALRTGFQWSQFLLDPLIFILWFAVAAALLFWGRGPFCGWLCPFGALQEIANRAAKALGVPQLDIPWAVHERLWPVKYIAFLVIFGVSLGSLSLAERLAEIEPFKTAIILRFMRDWWFVGFAAALLAAGLFVERFFCRYLCPLGGVLAILGRRMFDWLKRYRECGNPCMRCFKECPVQAIHPEGHINPNECISCLHCQMLYRHDQKCPVMVQRRIRREKRQALASTGPQAGPRPERPAPGRAGAAPPAEAVSAEPH